MVHKRLSKALYSLRTAKNLLNTSSLQLLYHSLFHCHLIYALPVWSCTNSSNLTHIFKMQKNAIRIINNLKYNAHTEPFFKSNAILPFPDLVDFFKLQFFQRFANNFLPTSFATTWIRNFDRNPNDEQMKLLSHNNFYIPPTRLTSTDKFPLVSLPKLWQNSPSQVIKNIKKKSEFDTKLKEYFLNDLNSTIHCNRLYCPTCSGVGT